MSIVLDQVTKQYQGTPVVNDVSLDVAEGEFFVLLGPSGSGKSTLLRAIAGLAAVDHGRITLRGRDVTQVSAREREVGFVFQNYALFRHMTVAENIEFALRVRRVKASERARRRKELLELVALDGMDERLPTQLSGGQQQRIAVARALAHKPKVLLLDEPFGALDAKIREELRRTIRAVQRELGITTILVTHDQEEAFALADRLGVMNLGRLLEVGRPTDLYSRPATRFVATFLGAANLLLRREPVTGARTNGGYAPLRPTTARGKQLLEHEVVAVLRPEEVELAPSQEAAAASFLGHGTVEELLFTGALERLRVRMPTDVPQVTIPGCTDCAATVMLEVTRTQAEQRAFPVTAGQRVAIAARRIHVLPTPISSFTVFGENEEDVSKLARQPWLVDIAARMQTLVAGRVESGLLTTSAAAAPTPVGVSVVATGPACPARIRWLLERGATEILCLPENSPPPGRVVIHCTAPSARRATLSVAASLLRHVPAEAVFVGILPPGVTDGARTAGVRELLDVRSEAQVAHGIDVRTELRVGDEVPELLRGLRDEDRQMLILGLPEPGRLTAELEPLLTHTRGWPVLLV